MAREASGSPISGMPILNVDKAKTVIVVKRSLSPGFAGIPNPLFAAGQYAYAVWRCKTSDGSIGYCFQRCLTLWIDCESSYASGRFFCVFIRNCLNNWQNLKENIQ